MRCSLGAGAVLLAVLLTVVAGCGGGGFAGGYSDEERAQFVDDCTTSGTPAATCRCFFDTMAERVPFSRYQKLQTAMEDGSKRIPDDVAGMAAACAGRERAAATRVRGR
jgi:hypothetical protein